MHTQPWGDLTLSLVSENFKNLEIEWIRSQIGLVTQASYLLSLIIKVNTVYE